MSKNIIKIKEFLVKHFEEYSADEKLTVKNVVEKIIWNEIVTGSSGTKDNTKAAQELLKVFLIQIRDEALDCVYDSLGNDNVGQVDKVFNKYLNEK